MSSADYDEAWRDLLRQRGIRNEDDACEQCAGLGTKMYGNTSGWRRGIGGQAMSVDVCDKCWGSGMDDRPWLNLRELEQNQQKEIARRATTAVADACGAHYPTTAESIREIIKVLDKLTNARKTTFWTAPLANGLANLLRRAIGDPERELK